MSKKALFIGTKNGKIGEIDDFRIANVPIKTRMNAFLSVFMDFERIKYVFVCT